jgi:nucleoside phosphorylase
MLFSRKDNPGSIKLTILLSALPFESAIIHKLLKEKKALTGSVAGTFGCIGKRYILVANSGVGSKACKNVIDALLNEFPNCEIILLGTAGAINPGLDTGDVVVANTPVSWESPVDERLMPKNVFGATCSKKNSPGMKRGDEKYSFKIFGGSVVSWDAPVFDDTVKSWLLDTAGALCVDMETGYAALLFKKMNLSFLTIRGISDMAGDDNKDHGYTHKIQAVWNATIVALEVLSSEAAVSMWPVDNL